MNPIAQAALLRARQPAPARPAYSTDQPATPKAVPMPTITGPINRTMLLEGRRDAIDMVQSLRAMLAGDSGLTQVINALKRAAHGRPPSLAAGYVEIIELLEAQV